MKSLFIILFSLWLIMLSTKALFNLYHLNQRIDKVSNILKGENTRKKAVKKNVDQKNIAFEKIIAKNNIIVGFLHRFQSESLWKIYSVIIGFSVFFTLNQFMYLIDIDQSSLLIVLVLITVVVILLPDKIVKMQAKRRVINISRDLPLVIDMMAIMVKSGMTVENGFKYLSSKVKPINRDVATILERACLMMDVNGIEAAVDLIHREVPSKEMRMFCVTLKRSIGYGNSIYESLLDLSAEIREMQKLTIEERIAAIAAKMTMPMMGFILLPVLVIVIAPIIMHLLSLPFFQK
ncbi:tight adherence protein C [Orbus hercynius]|uniref:Tight adherence protein C n=1 Tax=Orbus hercynius TaxID=593135 RepID=A0A495RJZ7_9GAMM|nr:type II secretion system F family protein [Orbus hercynius]RKS87863.1 tight adherence protein C [Orbus hercynius]